MARPSIELTEVIQARLCEALRVGASLKQAADYVGISVKTLRRWIARGQAEEDSIYGELLQQIEKAQSELAISLLLKINHAASKHWKAAAWTLERLFPRLYGKSTSPDESKDPHQLPDSEEEND